MTIKAPYYMARVDTEVKREQAPRVKRWKTLLRKAYKSLPPTLRHGRAVISLDHCLDFNGDVAAKSDLRALIPSISWNIGWNGRCPDFKSVQWLLAHEMAHWILGHKPNNKAELMKCEREAVAFQEKHGIPWKPSYKYRSLAHG
jgi:hypothetical protein